MLNHEILFLDSGADLVYPIDMPIEASQVFRAARYAPGAPASGDSIGKSVHAVEAPGADLAARDVFFGAQKEMSGSATGPVVDETPRARGASGQRTGLRLQSPANDTGPVGLFWAKVDLSGGPDACWPWIGARDADGYGLIAKRTFGELRAHRFALACKLCRPISPSLCALHSCDNPPCCNPAHLHEGTRADNSRERNQRGRAASTAGECNGRAMLTEEQVLAIRSWHARVPYGQKGGWFQVAADAFGVNRWAIVAVVYGKTWRHLLPAPARPTATPRSPLMPNPCAYARLDNPKAIAPRELLARSCTSDDAPCPGCLTGRACDGPAVYLPWLPGDELGAEGAL